MPYTQAHKQQTRERIVKCARRLFNRRGFSEVSIERPESSRWRLAAGLALVRNNEVVRTRRRSSPRPAESHPRLVVAEVRLDALGHVSVIAQQLQEFRFAIHCKT
jgi:hypothetical protein